MKKIIGHLEFFQELGLTSAVIRSLGSKGSFDGVLSLKEGDRLVIYQEDIIIFDEQLVDNKILRKLHYSAIFIPQGLEYQQWLEYLRKGLRAELTTNRQTF